MADGSTPTTTRGHIPGFAMSPLVKLGKHPGDCWQWLGHHDQQGNPRKRHADADYTARRWMWLVLFGPIPTGLVASNTCGARGCINPAHLVLRTQAQANQAGIGATLTAADVLEVRRLVDGGLHRDIVAERYGIRERTISEIMRRKTWKTRNLHKPCRLPKGQSHG